MKHTIFPLILILFCAVSLAAFPTEADAAVYENTLRLHVLANSDSAEDQAQKLALRDKILEKYGSALSAAENEDAAEEKAEALLSEIKKDCEEWLPALGSPYPVEVTLTTEWYETRAYEDFTLPEGYYRSLRVLIGEAEGQNWWCVMYPPLCLDLALEDAPDPGLSGYSPAERALVTSGGYRVRFKLLELAAELFFEE